MSKRNTPPCFSLVPCINKNKKKKQKRKNKKKNSTERNTSSCLFPADLKLYFPHPVTSFHAIVDCDDSVWEDYEIQHPVVIKYTYSRGMEGSTLKIIKGTRLEKDIVSLLSNDGKRDYLVRNNGVSVPVGSIRGKYILICCFLVPLPSHGKAAYICRSMISAYTHLSSMGINFEMVMVAKMARTTVVDDDEEAAFTRFFNAFPPHCLAIPFSDSESRLFVCNSLGLTNPYNHEATLVLHPDQTVLQTNGDCFVDFGAAAFPFSAHWLDTLARQEEELKIRLDVIFRESATSVLRTDPKDQIDQIVSSSPAVSLSELLSCQDSQLLWRFGYLGVEDIDKISVADLSKKKCVGLYLCYDGGFMKKLIEHHQDC